MAGGHVESPKELVDWTTAMGLMVDHIGVVGLGMLLLPFSFHCRRFWSFQAIRGFSCFADSSASVAAFSSFSTGSFLSFAYSFYLGALCCVVSVLRHPSSCLIESFSIAMKTNQIVT